jgi:hypothetical protein
MLLHEILKMPPDAAFAYLQRHVNDVLPFRADQTDIPPEFRPDGSSPGFNVPMALLDERECEVFECRPDPRLQSFVHTGSRVRFAVHPLMVERHGALTLCE